MPPNFFLEKTVVSATPYRQRGELKLGAVLISPQRSVSGSDVYRYMRETKPTDVILHFVDNQAIVGFSTVDETVINYQREFEMWYRVKLRGFTLFKPALHRTAIFSERMLPKLQSFQNDGRKHLFYTRQMRLVQGGYLTPMPFDLLTVLDCAYQDAYQVSLLAQLQQV